jgi:hypothetical protein
MVEVRLNNLTKQFVGYHQLSELPRSGDGIFIAKGNQYGDRLQVVDVTFRQPAPNSPFEIEVFVIERPAVTMPA